MLKHLTFARIAAAFVLLQIVVSAIAIVAYALIRPDWACDGTGLLTETFRASFPIPPDNTSAKAMFDCLFVPLSYAYIFSMVLLTVMLPRAIVSLVRDYKKYRTKYRAMMVVIFVYLGGSLALLFLPTEYATETKIKRQLLDGSAVAYLTFFSGFPFLNILLLLGLPNSNHKNGR
jgi:hypothetical protein